MFCIVEGCVFDGKVIHDEGKDGVYGLMLPYAGGYGELDGTRTVLDGGWGLCVILFLLA